MSQMLPNVTEMIEYPNKCPYCEIIVESSAEMEKHLNATHFRCAYCSKVVDNKDYDDDWVVCYECRNRGQCKNCGTDLWWDGSCPYNCVQEE